ncbi:hypothetical protein ACWZHB_03115 [Nocardia sp. FBN12]|uniref:hypothetical protein n=1 Tax=Nocardia sp. FBN12 TaxID=3419766 RepID=UPI003D06717F
MTNSHVGTYAGSGGKPGSPLAVVRAGFDRIATELLPAYPRAVPTPDAATASSVRTWEQLRERLWDPAVPIAEIDAIWVWLIERTHNHDQDAMLVCAGLAVPMLSRVAGEYATPGSSSRHDVESEVLTGFLTHLARVPLDRPGVWHRLRWAAYRAMITGANQQQSPAMSAGDIDCDLGPLATRARSAIAEPGHPETVLARAVTAGVISADAAELIAASRWEARSLTSLAAERGVSLGKLRKQRRRAERALLAWLTERARDLDSDRTSSVEAATVTALAPPSRLPRRGRRPKRDSSAPAQRITEHGQVAA